jgi:hypothetical protein
MENNTDRTLIAVNMLISEYELACNKNISEENEQCLDIVQLSNLHKLQMLTDTLEATQSLDLNHSSKEYVEEQKSEVVSTDQIHSPQSECSTESKYDKFYTKIESAAKKVESVEIKSKAYKLAVNELNDTYNSMTAGIDKYEDQLNCIDCKPNLGNLDLMPSFEFAWELKQFLANLKSLLKDIQGSLDDEKLLKDICNFYGLIKENALCLSSYPMILASVPILITKAKFELLEIGFSWTGIIGGLIASLLGAVTKLAEFLKNIIDSGFNCILRALALMRTTIDGINRLVNSIVEQAELIGSLKDYAVDGIGNFNQKEVEYSPERTYKSSGLMQQIFNRDAELRNEAASTKREVAAETAERKKKEEDVITEVPGTDSRSQLNKIKEDLLTDKVVLPKSEGNLGFRFQHSYEFRNYQQASLYAKSSKTFRENRRLEKYLGLDSLRGVIVKFENAVLKARDHVNDQAFKVIGTLKAISRMIVEPIFISAKLIGEIKALLNLARLIKLVVKMANKGFKNLCGDFDSAENNVVLASLIEEEFASTSIVFEKDPETESTIALAKNKYSGYESRIEPNDCGEVFVKVNETQRDLDLIYDSVVKSLG